MRDPSVSSGAEIYFSGRRMFVAYRSDIFSARACVWVKRIRLNLIASTVDFIYLVIFLGRIPICGHFEQSHHNGNFASIGSVG